MTELVFFFLISFIILISTLGYGYLFVKIANFDVEKINLGLVGFLGLFFLSIIASYSHIFIAHGYVFNITLITIGLILSYIFLRKFNQILSNSIKYLTLIFLFTFLCLIISKTNEDFPYYHLPNALQFVEQKLQFGLGNLNHGFKHISSIFMLMSLNYLPHFGIYLFNLTNFIFFIYLIYFAISEIYINRTENHNISRIFISLILILFLTKFSRLAEYGSDISGLIIISIYLYLIFEILFNKKLEKKILNQYVKLSVILIIFATTLKFILIIYSIFLIMIFYKNKNIFILQIFKLNYLMLIIPTIIIFLFLNFASTGCLIYPVQITCMGDYFTWALNIELIDYMNLHYETWSKGGKGPNFSVNDPKEYIISLNWVSNWINTYFFTKVTDFILITFSILLIFSLFFYKEIFLNLKKKNIINKDFAFFYILTIITFTLWFLNFPTLRYAGYIIVYLLLVFPFIIIYNNYLETSSKSFLKKISVIFIICYLVFLYKNVNRLNNELNIPYNQNHSFINFPYYWTDDVEFEEKFINNFKVYSTKGMCWNIPTTCVRGIEYFNIKKINNYIFYFRK